MISILIPCYNFSVNKLVQNIHTQTEIEKINYEIIWKAVWILMNKPSFRY